MTVLIVGGDRISSIAKFLAQNGYDEIKHWDARRNGDAHRFIPLNTRLVVILINLLKPWNGEKDQEGCRAIGIASAF